MTPKLAAFRSFSPSMLWRVPSVSLAGTGAAKSPPAAARASSSSTTSDSSGSDNSKLVAVTGSREHDLAREPVGRDQVIVAELLHRTITIDAHLECRRDDFPGLARRRRCAATGAAGTAAAGGASSRGGTAQPARITRTGPQELAHRRILQDLMPARNSLALWLCGANPALGDRRAADRPGDARQYRRRPAARAREAGGSRAAQVLRHHDTRTRGHPSRLAMDQPAPAPPPMPRWQHMAAQPQPLGAVRAPVRHAAFRLDDVLGLESSR